MTFTQGWEGPKVYACQLGTEPVRPDVVPLTPKIGIVPLRPLGLGDILSGTFRAVRYNPMVMFGLTVLVVLAIQVLATLASYVIGQQYGLSMMPFDNNGPFSGLGFFVSILAGLAAAALASVVVNMGLLYATTQAVSANRVRPTGALRHMGKRMWPALILAAMETTAAIAVLALAGLAIAAATNAGDGAVVAVVLAFMVFGGVPLIWLNTKLMFAPCAIAVEQLGPLRAIARSWRLTHGLFWRILGISLLVNWIVSMATGAITQGFGMFTLLFALSSEQSWAMLAATIAVSVVSVALTLPLSAAALGLLYVDARIRREGFDITLSEAMYR